MNCGLMLLVLGGVLAAWPAVDCLREFVAVDACLDVGGSFDYVQSRCDRGESHEFVAYSDRHPASWRIAAVGGVAFVIGIVMFVLDPKRADR
jgi:uncharacterized membrane protein HdeD (DUF308 family)